MAESNGRVTEAVPNRGSPQSLTPEEIERLQDAGPGVSHDESDPEPETLSTDRKFELLKNERRRHVLRYLWENGNQSTTGELAEHVAVLENDKESVHELTSKERKTVYVGLHQCHLPKMADYGVIDFNQARGTVELEPLADDLDPYLYEHPVVPKWPKLYLVSALVGAAIYGVAALWESTTFLTVSTISIIGSVLALSITQLRRQGLD